MPEEQEEIDEKDGRKRRKAIFSTSDEQLNEGASTDDEEEEESDSDDEGENESDDDNEVNVPKKKKSKLQVFSYPFLLQFF